MILGGSEPPIKRKNATTIEGNENGISLDNTLKQEQTGYPID